ncbi:hypothetical protein ACLX1H_002911 [Fusarium chlamydosporum]
MTSNNHTKYNYTFWLRKGVAPITKTPNNFTRPREEVQEIASEGSKAPSGSFEPGSVKAKEVGRKGGLFQVY